MPHQNPSTELVIPSPLLPAAPAAQDVRRPGVRPPVADDMGSLTLQAGGDQVEWQGCVLHPVTVSYTNR